MKASNGFAVDSSTLKYKGDEYPIAKIKNARVKTNTFKDHAARVVIIGLIVSSIVWVICPDSFGIFTAPTALIIGMLAALFSVRRYELQVEFEHVDETGLQWVSVAKSNKAKVRELFEQQAEAIKAQLV